MLSKKDTRIASLQLLFGELHKYLDNDSWIEFDKGIKKISVDIKNIFSDNSKSKRQKVIISRKYADKEIPKLYEELSKNIKDESIKLSIFEVELMESSSVG